MCHRGHGKDKEVRQESAAVSGAIHHQKEELLQR
jgi:hypothetical protein